MANLSSRLGGAATGVGGGGALGGGGAGTGGGGTSLDDPWLTAGGFATEVSEAGPREEYLELIGTHLRASGVVDIGRFRRITDYINLLDGYLALKNAVLLTRTGEATRVTMPELRVRLDDVAVVGQLAAEELPRSNDIGVHVEKVDRRLVLMTRAHMIYGFVHIIEGASVMSYVDSPDPHFIPMSRVHVRWLADRRLAARYPFALVQRSLILGVATEGTGAPREARARRREAVREAGREEVLTGDGDGRDGAAEA